VRNGYVWPSKAGLQEVVSKLERMSESAIDELREKLRIGIHWDTLVTLNGGKHLVTQAYCSALPVAYSRLPSTLWEPFARLVLEATYEVTLAATVLNALKTKNKTVYLTMVGGGAFGNDRIWILDAIHRACTLYQSHDLNVKIVSFRHSSPAIRELCESLLK